MEDYDDDFMVYVTAVLKVGLQWVPGEVNEKCIHLIPFSVCLSGPCYHGNIENSVYSCARWDSRGHEDATKLPKMTSLSTQHIMCVDVCEGSYLKDLSQNWHGYGKPAPPSSSPPVAMPRSQQPSGICEGDATSLLEGEEGTQDSPAGSSSPSVREGERKQTPEINKKQKDSSAAWRY